MAQDSEKYAYIAEHMRHAKALIITTGAGMGVDSGLPDFRGEQGFWRAYPMYERLGINFYAAANPEHFEGDPAFGWGFYGHRTHLYRDTDPHAGYYMVQQWARDYGLDLFTATSNVDGHFQKAGIPEDRVLEVHGSIHHLQCTAPCKDAIWENREDIPVDHDTMRAQHIPRCPYCGGVARPNILMFGDLGWISQRSHEQEERFQNFLHQWRQQPKLVIEIGAGTAVPTIRRLSERLGRDPETTVVRINPREPQIAPGHISLACGGLEGLQHIQTALDNHA